MIRIGIAAEGKDDLRVIRQLVDARLRALMGWEDQESLDGVREWVGDLGEVFLRLGSAGERAKKAGLPVIARVFGEGRSPDEQLMRAVLLLFKDRLQREPGQGLQAVVIVRDTDGDAGRREGFIRALESASWPFHGLCLQAAPDPKIEAWILLGFRVEHAAEQEALEEQRRRLGFDPTAEPNRISASTHGAKTDIKAVLHALTGGQHEREARCLRALLAECPVEPNWASKDTSFTDPRAFVSVLDRVLREPPGPGPAPGA